MDTSTTFPQAVSSTLKNLPGSFLQAASIEVTGKQIEKFPLLKAALPEGTKVFIALIEAQDADLQITAATELRKLGFEPIPHVPARFVRDTDALKRRMEAFAEKAGVTAILALGGGAPEPIGVFDAALQMMETGVFQQYGLRRIGIAGHPEGNPDITKRHGDDALLRCLQEKSAWISAAGVEGFIATQFLFEAGPVALWASNLRDGGINLPIHVGVPGPATIKTLVKYAAMCGVGNSARFIRKQALNITKLLTVSEPTEYVTQLARLHYDRPELNISAPHFYPFGGFDKLFAWIEAQR